MEGKFKIERTKSHLLHLTGLNSLWHERLSTAVGRPYFPHNSKYYVSSHMLFRGYVSVVTDSHGYNKIQFIADRSA